MATQEEHHEELVSGISKQMKPILENSKQGVYIYLDDTHWICNKKFATLLGYKSPGDLLKAERKETFLDVLVDEKSQYAVSSTYHNSMQKLIGATGKVTWKKKSGSRIKTNVIMVPISYNGHVLSLHFVYK